MIEFDVFANQAMKILKLKPQCPDRQIETAIYIEKRRRAFYHAHF